MLSLFEFFTKAQRRDVEQNGLAFDLSGAVQAAMTACAESSGGMTLYAPRGQYRLDSTVVPPNDVEIIGEPGYGGTCFVANNASAAFFAPGGTDKFRLRKMQFKAMGPGIGSAAAVKGPTAAGASYMQRCVFEELDIWNNLGYGFSGNFISTKWIRGEYGYNGNMVDGASFCPIRCYGDVAGNQANANVVDGVYVLASKGTDTLVFIAGANVAFRDITFESNSAQYTIRCLGITNVTIDGYSVENSNGAATTSPFYFGNDPNNIQGCSSIRIGGGYATLGSNNHSLIQCAGACGPIAFVGNNVFNASGKHIVTGPGADDTNFSQYSSNSTPGLTIAPTNYP